MHQIVMITNKKPVEYVPLKSKLTFLHRSKDLNGKKMGYYKCVCGTEKNINIDAVKRGNTLSCGCHNLESIKVNGITHGFSYHPLRSVWNGMMSRCYNPNCSFYYNYGGRGVTVCEEWKTNYASFVKWALENGWQKGLQLDKDIRAKELGVAPTLYSPDRCKFVTRKENLNCMRNNVLIEYMGETKTLTQWANQYKIHEATVRNRISYGWDIHKVLNHPVRKMKTNYIIL